MRGGERCQGARIGITLPCSFWQRCCFPLSLCCGNMHDMGSGLM